MTDNKIPQFRPYVDKEETGLPFDIQVDDSLFTKYRAYQKHNVTSNLTLSDIINIHILIELRINNKLINQ